MPDNRLNFLIHDLAKNRALAFNRLMEPHGLTRAQAWAIGALSRSNGLTQIDLANILNMTPVAVGTLLNRLESAGWVERRADQKDGRVRRVYLTSACQPLKRRIDEAASRVNQRSLAGFTETEVECLISLLIRMKANLEVEEAAEAAADGNQADCPDPSPAVSPDTAKRARRAG